MENPDKFRNIVLPEGVSPPEVTSLFFYTYALLNSGKELQTMLDEINSAMTVNQLKFEFIRDTVMDKIKCFGFRIIKPRKNFSYNKLILIDQESFLPIAVIKDFRGGSLSVNHEKISVGQYSGITYSKIRESVPKFDFLMSDKSLPKKVEVTDHIPFKEPFKIGDLAPSWLLPEMSADKLISSDSLSGNIVVLDFTSTWCIHCIEGAQVIKDLHQKYSGRQDMVFINVFSSSADTKDKVKKYIRQHEPEGITILGSAEVEKQYGIMGYPGFFLIDRHGRIAYFQRGYSPNLEKALAKQIDDCLDKK
jgi:thiol-disulfide isomerase/thioredoxin